MTASLVPRSEKQDSLVCLTGHMGQGYLEGGVAQMLFARDYGKGVASSTIFCCGRRTRPAHPAPMS
jgi:hypothetical protein